MTQYPKLGPPERIRKVTPEMRKRLFELFEQGLKQRDIAAELGISPAAVNYHLAKAQKRSIDNRTERHIAHGTRRGYQQHRAWGIPVCEDCIQGNTNYHQNYNRGR